jgi:hypothetical protein
MRLVTRKAAVDYTAREEALLLRLYGYGAADREGSSYAVRLAAARSAAQSDHQAGVEGSRPPLTDYSGFLGPLWLFLDLVEDAIEWFLVSTIGASSILGQAVRFGVFVYVRVWNHSMDVALCILLYWVLRFFKCCGFWCFRKEEEVELNLPVVSWKRPAAGWEAAVSREVRAKMYEEAVKKFKAWETTHASDLATAREDYEEFELNMRQNMPAYEARTNALRAQIAAAAAGPVRVALEFQLAEITTRWNRNVTIMQDLADQYLRIREDVLPVPRMQAWGQLEVHAHFTETSFQVPEYHIDAQVDPCSTDAISNALRERFRGVLDTYGMELMCHFYVTEYYRALSVAGQRSLNFEINLASQEDSAWVNMRALLKEKEELAGPVLQKALEKFAADDVYSVLWYMASKLHAKSGTTPKLEEFLRREMLARFGAHINHPHVDAIRLVARVYAERRGSTRGF